MSIPDDPFENVLKPYPCPACRRERQPCRDSDPACPRCGADLTLNDALRIEAHALRARGLRDLGTRTDDAKRALRASQLLEPHPTTQNALAIAAACRGDAGKVLGRVRRGGR